MQALQATLGNMNFFPQKFKYTLMDIVILEVGELSLNN